MTEKRFNVFDVDGTIFLEDHKEGSYHIGELGNVDVICLNDIADRLNGLTAKNKVLRKEIERLKRQNEDILYNNAKNMELLEKENRQLKQQIKHSQKRTAIISGWLHDEGNLTLNKYEEILDYCYQEYKKGKFE